MYAVSDSTNKTLIFKINKQKKGSLCYFNSIIEFETLKVASFKIHELEVGLNEKRQQQKKKKKNCFPT